MNSDHIRGAADQAKGTSEHAAGKVTGDAKWQAEGNFDKAKGAVRSAIGDVRDAVKDAIDRNAEDARLEDGE